MIKPTILSYTHFTFSKMEQIINENMQYLNRIIASAFETFPYYGPYGDISQKLIIYGETIVGSR